MEKHNDLMVGDQLDVEKAQVFEGPINCSDLKIRSLKGIENFTSLTTLNCSDNKLKKLDLKKLTKLEVLYCENNLLRSIEGLKELRKLSTIEVAGNMIDDATELTKVNKLLSVDISGNKLAYWNTKLFEKLSEDNDIVDYDYYVQNRFGKKNRKAYSEGDDMEIEVPEDDAATGYQWYRNGQKIEGANSNKLSVPKFNKNNDKGSYSCQVKTKHFKEKGKGKGAQDQPDGEEEESDVYESEPFIIDPLDCGNILLEMEDVVEASCQGDDGSMTFTVSNGAAGNLYRIRKQNEFGDYKIFTNPSYINISNVAGESKEVTIENLENGIYDLYVYCGSDPSKFDKTVVHIEKDSACAIEVPQEDCPGIQVILDKTRIGNESYPGAKDVDVTFKIRNGSENNIYRVRKQDAEGNYVAMTAPSYIATGNDLGEEFDITVHDLGVGMYDIYGYCGKDPSYFIGQVFQIFLAPQDGAEVNCEGIDIEISQDEDAGLRFSIKNGSEGNYYRLRKKANDGSYTVLTVPGFVNAGNQLGEEAEIEFDDLEDGEYDVYAYCGQDPSNYKGILFTVEDEVVHNCRVTNLESEFEDLEEQTAIEEFGSDFIFEIYPNPADETFSLRLAGFGVEEDAQIRVLSTNGQLMYKEYSTAITFDNEIDVSDWAPGIYYVEVRVFDEFMHKRLVVN